MSRSYTSRAARPGETDGLDYNFVTRDRFEEMIAAGDFLEWADVFGNLYGTCASDTDRMLEAGQDVVLVIDVQGARQVREQGIAGGDRVRDASFVRRSRAAPPRPEQGPEAAIQRRLQVARDEVASFRDYDYVVINDELDSSVDRLRAIVLAERARLRTHASGRR